MNYKAYFDRIKNYSKDKNYKVFVFFFFISTIFWVLIKFKKDYTVVQKFEVEYVSIPKNLVWFELPTRSIELRATANGFRHLRYSLGFKKLKLSLAELKKHNSNKYYICPEQQLSYLSDQFSSSVQINYVSPDSMFFDFSKKISKKVKVQLNDSITLAKSYKFKGKLQLSPDSVIVTGPESLIKDIFQVPSQTFVKLNVKSNSQNTVALKSFSDKRIEINQSQVEVGIEVEKFTQNSLLVPIQIENVPSGYMLKTFPDKVEIVFNSGLSEFESIKQGSFTAVVDYNRVQAGNDQIIPVEVTVHNDKAELIRVVPKEVEFLLRPIENIQVENKN